jgi:hypothetical protein
MNIYKNRIFGFSMLILIGSNVLANSLDSDKKLEEQNIPLKISSSGNYVGDCVKPFKPIYSIAQNNNNQTAPQKTPRFYRVLNQQMMQNGDIKLKILPLDNDASHFNFIECAFTTAYEGNETISSISVKDLADTGFQRYGWTYGALILPYKYYSGSKKFIGSSTTLGPYLGFRNTIFDRSITWAGSFGITQVQGNLLDFSGKAILDTTGKPSQTSMSAITMALGIMIDINKGSNGESPLKIGLFYGNDRVSGESSRFYPDNKKGWFAFQVGIGIQ